MPGFWDEFDKLIGLTSGGAEPPQAPPAPAQEYNIPQPPATRQAAMQPMKKYGLLTSTERVLFEKILPGVRGSWAGSAMQWVANNPIASKVLPWLDILAEGIERTSGLMNQMEYYKPNLLTDTPAERAAKLEATKHLFTNLSETWRASSLNYNFADLPQLILEDISEGEKRDLGAGFALPDKRITGIRMPDDMPGVEGLNKAREMLIAGATMEEVEAAFEDEMGALWMRGQMYDMYGHILLDPFNYLMPLLKPITKSAFASRINKVTRIANLSDDVIAASTDALKAAEKAGNMADVAKYTEILKGQEGLTTFEKISDFLAGGRELLPDEALKAPTDAGWLRRTAADIELAARKGVKVKGKQVLPSAPHTLTPASRGAEAAVMVKNSLQTHVFQAAQDVYEADKLVNVLEEGALSGIYGKYVLTPEGRLVQGLTHGMSTYSKFRTGQYAALETSGVLDFLADAAKTLDTTIDDVAQSLIHDKGVTEIAEGLGRNSDELLAIGKQLKGSPYTYQTWQLSLQNDVIDMAEQATVAMYGISTRGKIQAWAGVLKSAETLAWLKMNPSFPIKNYVTDEMFMLAQGVTGKMGATQIDEYWKLLGFEVLPERLRQGIGMAGLEGGEVVALGKGAGPIAAASLGKPGAASKITKWINDINLGPFDMATLAQKIESKHSAQAFTVWHQRAMGQWWRPGVGFDPIDSVVSARTLEIMEAADPGIARKFNNWASSQMGKKGLDDFLDANYNISMDEILDEARIALGYDVDLKQVLPPEYLISLKVGLPEAARTGKIRSYLGKFRRDLQTHLDDMALSLETRVAERAAVQVQLEGPQAWVKLFTATIDDLQGFHVRQAVEMVKIDDLLRGASKADAGLYWAKQLPEAEQTWARGWGRASAMLKGINKGTKGKLPQRVVRIFDERVAGWKKFYKVRNTDYATFFDARKAGEVPPVPWDTLKAKHSMMYTNEIGKEANLLDEMFEIVAKRLDDPVQQELFRNIAAKLHDGRLADKQKVVQLQEDLSNAANAVERQQIHNAFWQGRYSDEIHTFEQAAAAAMQGNAEAAQQFAQPLGKAAEGVAEAAPAGKQATFLPDINQFWPEEPPIALAQDQFWFNRGYLYIDAVEQAALAQAAKKPLKIAEMLPKEAIDEVSSWIGQVKGNWGDINNAAVRMGEYGRDASLLNYSRRYNYNTWLGTVAPYEFWMTQSMMKWALHSIDHPAMLSTYWRYQKMLETVGAPNQQIPSRLRDHFKVELPFMEENSFMGKSIWVNPTRLMLPMEQFSYPFQEWNRRIRSKEGKTEYLINQWVEAGTITRLQAEEALEQQGGDLWDSAQNEVEGENSELRTGPFDFATIFASPHAPLMWAYHALNNEKEKISPLMPLTRYSKAAQGLLGPGLLGDIAGIPYQTEAKIRTALGLPAFDEWDDYRIERMMTNLAGEGKYPYEEVMRQWIAKEGPIWEEAKTLSDKEFGISGLGSAIGLSLKAYPPGEEKQRLLQVELSNAFAQKEANPDAEVDPVWQFYQKHPEYSARQALWDEPEDRMRKFMFDLIYDKWNDMPKLHRDQVLEATGQDINSVLYPDDAEAGKTIKSEIPIGILQSWLMAMGGDVPGKNEGFAFPVDFIDPAIANRAQVYYDSISYLNPDFWDVSNEYYENPVELRKQWGLANPEKYELMKKGWEFKRDWLWRNPDIAPYITDDEDWWRKFSTVQEREQVMAQTPDFRPEELIANMPQEAQRLVYDYVYRGDELPESVEDMLQEMAEGLGITVDKLLNMLVDNR